MKTHTAQPAEDKCFSWAPNAKSHKKIFLDGLWLWCLKILACHTHSFDKTFQHEVVRHGLAGDGIRKWAVLQLQRTNCSVPMSKAIMLQLENRKVHQTQVCSKNDMGPYGFPWFPVFFQTILQFLYVFLPKLIFCSWFKGIRPGCDADPAWARDQDCSAFEAKCLQEHQASTSTL